MPKPYADDLTLTAKDPEKCQILLNSVDEFLTWTRTMKAKPVKCKAHAMKKFVPNMQMRQEGHKTQKYWMTGKSFYHTKKSRVEARSKCNNIEVAEHLNLPKPSDKASWKVVDDILNEELPVEMGGNPEEQLDNLERHVYKRLKERFSIKIKSNKCGPKKSQKTHQQRKIRRLKKMQNSSSRKLFEKVTSQRLMK